MAELYLTISEKEYDSINQGKQTEIYRDICPYWLKWFVYVPTEGEYFTKSYDYVSLKMIDSNRHMRFKIKKIVIAKGKQEWGAEKGKLYFVVRLEKRIG